MSVICYKEQLNGAISLLLKNFLGNVSESHSFQTDGFSLFKWSYNYIKNSRRFQKQKFCNAYLAHSLHTYRTTSLSTTGCTISNQRQWCIEVLPQWPAVQHAWRIACTKQKNFAFLSNRMAKEAQKGWWLAGRFDLGNRIDLFAQVP